jgi:filamentous hemagglutinin
MKKKYLGLKQQFLLLSLCSGSLMASHAHGGPTIPGFIGNTADVLPQIPVTALPTGGTAIRGIDSIRETATNAMEISQNQPKAVIHWQTFNIGSQASVNFNQQGNAGWAALNSIGDASPSQIHGRLSADGAVYLINQNGIFFGPTAQVNVHSLTASSLNLTSSSIIDGLTASESAFVNGYTDAAAQSITFRNAVGTAGASVENSGTITTADSGKVFLIGGKAVNSGTITAKNGMVAMAAGDEVTVAQNSYISRYALPLVSTTGDAAEVTNTALLQADEGIAGLYGGIVNQNGRVIATTAVSRNGRIELQGHTSVSTGAGSITATPVSTSSVRQTPSEDFSGGQIKINTKEFNHKGIISSPGGTVSNGLIDNKTGYINLETIRLESGSSIDVSGLWVDQALEDRILEVQLNSDVLKDAYSLKYGLLSGETVRIDTLYGMPAADISAYLSNRPRSAAELLTEGGTIEFDAGRVEFANGSSIDISGGGYKYAAGELDLTMVRVGIKLLSLSDLPVGTPVDEVMGSFTRNHARYGVSETWIGMFYGNGAPLPTSSPAFSQGSDAGTLTIRTPYLFMAGMLDGWAERGLYQTEVKDRTYSNGNTMTLGRRMPKGGTLAVGSDSYASTAYDAAINEVITYAISMVPTALAIPDENESERKVSYIPAEILNNAGLSVVELHAATTFNLSEDISIHLAPGGSFNASARQIEVDGVIQAAGGDITLETQSNWTSFSHIEASNAIINHIPLEERLTIGSTAVLDVAGEEISGLNQQKTTYGYTKGGNITLTNQSIPSKDGNINSNHGYELTVATGSRLSVQGGYWQDSKGNTTGGDAGSLIIRQKITEDPYTQKLPDNLHLAIDGELLGHALLGNKGGNLTIETSQMTIFPTAGDPPPASFSNTSWDSIVLADNRFADTGFSSISLKTYGDLTVSSGSHLEPSLLRRTTPSSYYGGAQPAGLVTISSNFIEALPLEAGSTSIALSAGIISFSDLILEEGSTISVAPNGKGKITLTTGGLADIGGTLNAPAGSIEITGTDIDVDKSARLFAQGINLEELEKSGPFAETNWRILDGGSVSLTATYGGSLAIESGSLIDVSGSPLVMNTLEDNLGGLFHRYEAGSPGTISLIFYDELTLNGTLSAESFLPSLPGGTLSFKRTHNSKPLTITAALAESSQQVGFDSLRFASPTGIDFAETTTLTSDRRLVLDTPQIISSGGSATLDAPWVQIINNQNTFPDDDLLSNANTPTQMFTTNAEFLDISGNIQLDGFSKTILSADQARLSDWFSSGNPGKWSGYFKVNGDLTLQANVIFPTSGSIFTLESSGLISILPGPNTSASPVYSAGGDLTIKGHDIYHAGYLAAPMGNITFTAEEGRILLAPDSRTSVSGAGNISYGSVNQGIWKIVDKNGISTLPTKLITSPEPSITISGREVLITEGSRIEADGGGNLKAHEFLPGLEGAANPLLVKDRLVIVPDNSISLPELGEIYLEGYAPMGLAEGVYSVLPAEFAFLPGALIIERGSSEAFAGQEAVNLLHQPIIAGYEKAFGSNEQPSAMTSYVLRTAADVLTEGKFEPQTKIINNGGDISISGETLVMLGDVSALGVENGNNGGLTLAGAHINYAPVPEGLRALTSIADLIPVNFIGNAYFDNGLTSGNAALGRLTLGDFNPETNTGRTKSVTFAPGQSLTGIPHVIIKAADSITINEGTTIQALSTSQDEGVLELYTASLTTKDGSMLHASNELGLHISGDWDFGGAWKVDDGRVHLASSLFSIGSEGANDPGTGLLMTQAMLNAFAGVKELWIESETDIRFVDKISLVTSGSLLLDSQRLLFEGIDSTPFNQNVSISADTLRLRNSYSASTAAAPTATNGHNLQLNANNLTMGPGTVRVDGFTNVNLNTSGILFFEGQGSFQAKLPEAGILTITANGFFADYPEDVETLSANRFSVDSALGKVLLQNSGAAAPTFAGTPGNLAISGRAITMDAALLDFPGGRVELTATGIGADDKVLLKNGTRILAQGGLLRNSLDLSNPEDAVTFQLTGGEVLLSAANGQVIFENTGNSKNIIDVSAKDNQNGGRVSIDGGASDLDLGALTLLGGGGVGGSLDLVTRALPELGELAAVLSAGGFTNKLSIQAREDDMNLAAGWTLAARAITLAADGENDPSGSKGKITIAGTVNASGTTGGTIHLYAEQDLTLAAGGRIEAKGSEGAGGKIVLGSEEGFVRTDAASTIDTTGAGFVGNKDGSVTFRVDVTGDSAAGYGVKLVDQGTTYGAKNLQAVKSYTNLPLDVNIWKTDVTYMVADLTTAGYALVPEIEVNATGDLTLPNSLTLTSIETWRPGDDPKKTDDDLYGVLTFRAAGNLKVETSITDAPSPLDGNVQTGYRDPFSNNLGSWSFNLIAGADHTAADPLAVCSAKDLTIGKASNNKVVVYSESGDINLVAGKDIKIMTPDSNARYSFNFMPGVRTYTLGTFDGDIQARAGRNLEAKGGVLQSSTGAINIETRGDVLLENNGAIRTTGRMPIWDEIRTDYKDKYYNSTALFWMYRDGGNITIRSGGKILGSVMTGTNLDAAPGWENAYQDLVASTWQWSANYDHLDNTPLSSTKTPTYGIATMGGGNISIETGNDFLAQAGAFGQNNEAALQILAKGNLDGRFLTMRGDSLLSTHGSFGTSGSNSKSDIATGIGMGDNALIIQAMGSVEAGTIYNPTLANSFNYNTSGKDTIQSRISYTAYSKATLAALNGDVLLTGATNYKKNTQRDNILPGTLTMTANRDVNFTNAFFMAPAPNGSLTLLAGQDIQGRYTIYNNNYSSSLSMSDAGMDLYLLRTNIGSSIISSLKNDHSTPPLHQSDITPVHIKAGRDIDKINFTLAKKGEIIAARDLLNITYLGQHMHVSDVSILAAGRDFLQSEVIGTYKPGSELPGAPANPFQGITQAGPGSLFIQAGNNIDLANSSGIQSTGSTTNSALQDASIPIDANGRIKGSDITVIAGYDTLPSTMGTTDFLTKLKSKIREVSAFIAEGKEYEAAIMKEEIRNELFTPFLYDHLSGTGDLNMTTSGIQTISGNDAINIFAAGDVNVGITTIKSTDSTTVVGDKETGILTAGGGPINLLAGGDVNVNESRVMTFLGGDIIILSDEGDINAGRGSKAKVTAAEPQIIKKDGVTSVVFSPPAVGSGLRTLAYDPDGNGPRVTPEPGDMYVVAWDGVVDAGEAGIEGGRLYLAATKVLNSQNISVGAGSVGVPSTSGAPVSLGALSGDSMSATESTTSDIAKSTAGAGDKMADTAKKIADTISQLRFFVVKFLGFIE